MWRSDTSIDRVELMMKSLLANLVAIVLLGTGPASASIRITDARYEGGVLIVSGQATPNQDVTLDGKYNTKANGGGHFEFRESYRPSTCMSNITAGEDSYSTIITNCLLNDAAAAVSPSGKAGATTTK
jgi:hypothetical protein